ncbi:MAG: HlyD family efflux transporter periplasmic adaptor subunit [Candidatus Kaiserbacteria bacterium]|nr:HlyD family efflux transporter periplasmic adaptor subunit [Candidatus Kaiserbacteria bacterium]
MKIISFLKSIVVQGIDRLPIWIGITKNFARAHKFWSAVILFFILGGGWWAYGAMTSTSSQTSYVLGTVAEGTVVSSVSVSGQVSASNQVDIKPKVSGDLTWLGAKAGMSVKKGQALATIDDTSARQDVINAQLDLKEAQLTLEKDTSQAPIDYQNTKDAVTDAKNDLADAYDDSYTTTADSYVSLLTVMNEADDLLQSYDLSVSSTNVNPYQNISSVRTLAIRATDDYNAAFSAHEKTYAAFKLLSRSSSSDKIEQTLKDAQDTTKLISQFLTNEVNLIDTVISISEQVGRTISSSVTTQQTSAHTQLSTANSVLSKLTSQIKALQSAKSTLKTAQQAFAVASVDNPDGTTSFDIELEKNDVAKKEAALATAKQTLADHTVRAPFDGVLATVDIEAYESVSTASSIATIITNERIIELSLSEADIAKVSLGDKATLTFDAIEDLTLTGTVAEIDALGTVSSGVVSYTVKLSLDTNNENVKPGMSVTAEIITDSATGLVVSSNAVKTSGTTNYVLVFDPELSTDSSSKSGVTTTQTPNKVTVEIGLVGDSQTIITSGLTKGQQIVTKTTSGSSSSSSSSSSSKTTTSSVGGLGGITGGGPPGM